MISRGCRLDHLRPPTQDRGKVSTTAQNVPPKQRTSQSSASRARCEANQAGDHERRLIQNRPRPKYRTRVRTAEMTLPRPRPLPEASPHHSTGGRPLFNLSVVKLQMGDSPDFSAG